MQEMERILNITLDESVAFNRTPEVEHEYRTAVADLLQENFFHLCKNPGGVPVARGPYNLYLSIVENRLVMDIGRLVPDDTQQNWHETRREKVTLPITPLRSIVRDYFFICESYYKAVKETGPRQLEAIDMGRRGLHDEGATLLQSLLQPEIEVDFTTARRLFTLVCVLHIK